MPRKDKQHTHVTDKCILNKIRNEKRMHFRHFSHSQSTPKKRKPIQPLTYQNSVFQKTYIHTQVTLRKTYRHRSACVGDNGQEATDTTFKKER